MSYKTLRRNTIDTLNELIEWDAMLGYHESDCWATARKFRERLLDELDLERLDETSG